MIPKTELIRWLKTLPDDSNIGIDAGGLTLLVNRDDGVSESDGEACLEIGGISEEDGR